MPTRVETDNNRRRAHLKSAREALASAFLAHPRPRHYLRAHARLVDTLLTQLCDALLPAKVCLAAVGGYGRGELFPASDVDLLLLIPCEPDAPLRDQLESWVRACWDCGLEIGHSIRTPEECLEEAARDITVETALLEARPLWGDEALFAHFQQGFMHRLDTGRFLSSKILEQRNRHHRYADTAYNLEPNLKDSPGGLRDLHLLGWLARAALPAGVWGNAATGVATPYNALTRAGLLSSYDARQLSSVHDTLNLLRIHLHLLARRREDRLAFDYQTRLAENLGLSSTARYRASEVLMRRYYRAASQVRIANELLLPALQEQVSGVSYTLMPLNDEFALRGNQMALRDPHLFTREPAALFRLFLTASEHGVSALDPTCLRALWHGRLGINRAFRADPGNRAAFLEILRQPRGVTWSVSMLVRYGLLGRYLPAFARITGQMQHDGFHIYTVDQHTLAVLRNLRRFTVSEFSHEFPLASRLISAFDKPELLYLAALFHDIAKGRGGDHSELGTHDARAFCSTHGLPPEDTELVAWLVGEHLSLSRVAQKEDLSDESVIAQFVSRTPTRRHLDALYLLTVADIRGTSPRVWNAWKGKLLESLYFAASARMSGQGATALADKLAEARSRLALYGIRPDAADVFWKTLDESYFLRFDAQDLAWHARMLWQRAQSTTVRARLSPAGDGIQVLIYCPDLPDLFSRVCGFFARNQFSVVEARVHTTRHGYALDSFQVLDDARRDVHYRDFLQFVEHELSLAIAPDMPRPNVPTGQWSRRLKHFPIQPEVEVRPDEQGRFHSLSITCGDRVGLLYGIAEVFRQHGIELHGAKIHTLGERVEDRFLIRGEVLNSEKGILALEKSLLEVIAAP